MLALRLLPFVYMSKQNYIMPRSPGLFDYVNRLEVLLGKEDPLARLDAVVDWNLFLPIIEAVRANAEPRGPGGRPAWPAMILFKFLLIQRFYSLSDEDAEFQLLDRLSFQRFVGLTLADKAPDQNTLRLFREQLVVAGAEQKLFDTFNTHLGSLGLFPKSGVMIDATFVEVPRQRNTREENESIKAGTTPTEWKNDPKLLAHKDLDARWTKKNDETYYGYKDHVKANVASKLIESAVITPASTHDSQALGALVKKGDEVVFADSAYAGKPQAELLEKREVAGCIVPKPSRGQNLTDEEKETGRRVSGIRSRVEHVFALMSGTAGRIFQRYIGLARNAGAIVLTNLIYNLRRYEQIRRLKIKVAQ